MILSLEFDKNKNWNMITQPVKDYFLSMKRKYKGDFKQVNNLYIKWSWRYFIKDP